MSRRVLVVDDEPEIRAVLRAYLEHDGFVVAEAGTGAEALRRVLATDGTAPDVVLLDIGLPRLNGYEVCRRIREAPWGARMHIVAVTGWGQDSDRERSRAAGFNAHMVKPVNAEALMKLLGASMS